MSAFDKHHDELERHETMMGQSRGRLAVALDLLGHHPRSLPSRVEIRPAQPPRK